MTKTNHQPLENMTEEKAHPTTSDEAVDRAAHGSETVEWPTDEGIWMARFESIGWFPIRSKYLRDDLPTREEMAREAAGEVMPPRKVLAIVAQFPESATSWPFTFQKCHPAKEWRRPTAEEME